MPVERHEQDGDQEIRQLRAEVAELRDRLAYLVRLLAAQQEAAPQNYEDGRRAGYEERLAEERAPVPHPRHRRDPGERWLRAVPGVAVPVAASAGRVVLRHKVALAGLGAAALITAVTVPAWHTAEFRVGVPGHGPGASVVAQAFAPQGPPSSPPGHASPPPHPSPGSSHGHGHGSPSPGPQGTPPGHATPSPSPSPDATTDPGSPSATPAPDPGTPDPGTTAPDPGHTPAACTPAP